MLTRIAQSKWILNINSWLQSRTQRERVMVLVGALLVCTVLWYSLWENMYQSANQTFLNERQSLEEKIVSFKAQNKALQTIINSPVLAQKRDQLAKNLKDLDAQLEAVSTQLVSPQELANALKDILGHTQGLVLLSLSNTSSTLLTPNASEEADKGGTNSNSPAAPQAGVNITSPASNHVQGIKLYQHEFTMEFDGDYFSVLQYLKKLETSAYRFYGDSLDYRVTQYPKAKILLKVHTISKGKDLIND